MSEYRVGEVVDITIRGARVVNGYPHYNHQTQPVTVKHIVVVATSGAEGNSVAITVDDPAVTVTRVAPPEWPLRRPGARRTAVSPVTDPRDAVIAAARALVASWHVAYPSGTAMAAAIGGREGELDAALARLDAATYQRDTGPEPTGATAADHWQPTGRPVSSPPVGGA